MKLLKSITVKDLLKYVYIDYDGVEEAFEKAVESSNTCREAMEKFHEYYSEYGLGGDSKWELCETYLPLMMDLPY